MMVKTICTCDRCGKTFDEVNSKSIKIVPARAERKKKSQESKKNGLEAVFQDWIQKHNFYPNFYTIPAADVYTYDGEQLIQEGDAK